MCSSLNLLGVFRKYHKSRESVLYFDHYYPRTQASRVIGEQSEPLSRVFNDQLRGIYIYMVESVRTYVPNTHARVSVLQIKFKS